MSCNYVHMSYAMQCVSVTYHMSYSYVPRTYVMQLFCAHVICQESATIIHLKSHRVCLKQHSRRPLIAIAIAIAVAAALVGAVRGPPPRARPGAHVPDGVATHMGLD